MIINLANIDFSGGGSGGGMTEDQEYVISVALNNLNDRLKEVEEEQEVL